MLWVLVPPGLYKFGIVIVMLGKAKNFLGDVKVEVKKVTWPSRKEAVGGTMVVVVVVVIVAIFLGIVDKLLSIAVQELISG